MLFGTKLQRLEYLAPKTPKPKPGILGMIQSFRFTAGALRVQDVNAQGEWVADRSNYCPLCQVGYPESPIPQLGNIPEMIPGS